jgi:hypothetical protein
MGDNHQETLVPPLPPIFRYQLLFSFFLHQVGHVADILQ